MPLKGKYKKKNFKRAMRRKNFRKYKRTKNMISRRPVAFPAIQEVTMRYCQSLAMAQGALTVYDTRVFLANGLTDPNITTFNHRPLGYDQWSVFYEKYVIKSSRITVTVQSSNGAPNTVPPIICVYRSDTPSPPIVLTTYVENRGKYIMISPTTNGNSFQKSLSVGYVATKQHNIVDLKDCESLEGTLGEAGVDPVDKTYYNVMLAPYDDSTASTYEVSVLVTIDYVVLLKDPKPLTRSV